MLRNLDRLRRRPARAVPIEEPPRSRTASTSHEVELVAYAEDCIVSGHVRLAGDRLSDLLNDTDEFELVDVLVEDLLGSDPIELRDMVVNRDEILLVHATGPRGNPGRRHRTRQHPIVAKAGPYVVRGYVHALPGSDPIASLRRRKPMIALTEAVIEYTIRSVPQARLAGVVILNRDCTDWIVEGHDDEVVMPEMPVDSTGLLLKDFTGHLIELGPTRDD